ncbi:putative phosphatidylethanolamine-binding protein [Helianthus annuus]|uniref:Phosphatidylethanolamine-binding protein n=1 Tax=Helianthus annuus TaxID=4232 RepID=A0A251U5A7_HELAN|nr:putative phosphatidylethanolamine-binding protein [Helianthus annuus]KAJ0438024.1 putative phosphatidylethanolamine-binding protein [Helianthus annuus]KAJ0442632.1 putative phosphatidylethanolamine-binding protein [Helianthus annuus]KAJ0460350.1 putative phosphatidylethanolamine-binding protein [Helianthus annuus]KAJ0644702.1 putative phosphatidylethanolamine-binding protein [Helianthus annuus]
MSSSSRSQAITVALQGIVEPFEPTVDMTVYYDNRWITSCSTLKYSDVTPNPPRVEIGNEQPNQLYTLIMIDPDAPTPDQPSHRELVTWIVTNIPSGSSSASADGTEVVPYNVVNPRGGFHRQVMLLYRQSSIITQIITVQPRTNFSSSGFAATHNLGNPVGVVYFHVRR